MAPRRAPPQLIDAAAAEILLRLPPDEPEHLFRAALICKRWLRIICDPGFLRRYRASHRPTGPFRSSAPARPLRLHHLGAGLPPPGLRRPPLAPPRLPPRPRPRLHGGGRRRRLPRLEPRHGPPPRRGSAGHRLAARVRGCDHLDCHGGGPFRFVFAATPELMDTIFASVYSSEADEWSVPVRLDSGHFTWLCVPPGSSLYVWSRKVNTEEPAEWVQYRVIELEEIVPVADLEKASIVVGSAEGVGVVFVSTDVGLFMINLNSGQPKKVDEPGLYFSVLPYMSFYTPDRGKMLSLARAN